MANPIPGSQYIVVTGDTLSGIAARAYGDPNKWTLIYNANQSQLKSSNPDLVFPGEIIFIPPNELIEDLRSNLQAVALGQNNDNTITLFIEDREIPVYSGSVVRTMDTIADGAVLVFAWEYGKDLQLDALLKPFKYPNCKVYIGDELQITGKVYITNPQKSNSGSTMTVSCFSKAIDSVDSTKRPPYEQTKVTLKQRVESLFRQFSVGVEYELEDDSLFDRVTIGPTETIFSHVAKLTSERSALITSTPQGKVKIYNSQSTGRSVGTIEEGGTWVEKWAAVFDGRKRWNTYRAIGQNPLSGTTSGIVNDSNIPGSRFLTFNADDTVDGDVLKAAKWKRSKQMGEALKIPMPLNGWYAPDGSLFKEDSFLTVKSPTIFLPDGYNFLINRVEFKLEPSRVSSNLSLVPPQTYTGEETIDPWGKKEDVVVVERGLR